MEVRRMSNIVAEDLQKQILSAIRKGNEVTVEKLKAAVEAVTLVKIPAAKITKTTFNTPKFREDAVAYARKLPARRRAAPGRRRRVSPSIAAR
jgi:hypothetical protein